MNKKTLISKISSQSGLRNEKSEQIFNKVLNVIYSEVKKKKECKIEGFGEFKIEHRAKKLDTDKRSKEKILLPPKDRIRFKPSGKLLEEINKQ